MQTESLPAVAQTANPSSNTTVAPLPTRNVVPVEAREFTEAQIELIRANGGHKLDDAEFEAFLHVVRRTGLDPLARQVYAVKRWSSQEKREVMSIQTGIDGYRLIADRTARYAPSERPPYLERDDAGQLIAATVWVKKLTDDGIWHEVPGTALYSEFVQKDRDGAPTRFWKEMPVNQLCKCAEAQALRRAFPNDLSGIWTTDTAPREDFDVETIAEPRRAIARPQAKNAVAKPALPPPAATAAAPSAAAAPAPAAAAYGPQELGPGERRFVVKPAKTNTKTTKAGKEFWELVAASGEKFVAWKKPLRVAFQTAMDRGWEVEVIERKNGDYWNTEKVTPIEPPPAPAKAAAPVVDDIPVGDEPIDVLDGVSDESRDLFENR